MAANVSFEEIGYGELINGTAGMEVRVSEFGENASSSTIDGIHYPAMSNITYINATEDNLYKVPVGVVVLLSVLYGTVSALTVCGNTLVILVIVKNRKMHNVTNFFIGNLACADILIGLLSIPFQFQAALLQRWNLPYILCPIAPFVKELSVSVSILTLAVVSMDRYFAIIHPLKPRCSSRIAKIVMAVLWTFCIGSAVPSVIVYRVGMVPDHAGGTKPLCYPVWPQAQEVDLSKLYRLYLVVLQYFFPLIIICYAYFRIIFRIWGTRPPGSAMDSRDQIMHRNKKKVIQMLVTVVALFAFCWLPLQTYMLLSQISTAVNEYRYINIIFFCSDWLAMSNSCYNPFIYGLLNEKFKHGFRRIFSSCPCVTKESLREPFPEHYCSEESMNYSRRYSCNFDRRRQANGGPRTRTMKVTYYSVADSSDQTTL